MRKIVICLVFSLFLAGTAALLNGCSTPHERYGVSTVPQNAEEPSDYHRTFNGSF